MTITQMNKIFQCLNPKNTSNQLLNQTHNFWKNTCSITKRKLLQLLVFSYNITTQMLIKVPKESVLMDSTTSFWTKEVFKHTSA
jgi:hypothetical protein